MELALPWLKLVAHLHLRNPTIVAASRNTLNIGTLAHWTGGARVAGAMVLQERGDGEMHANLDGFGERVTSEEGERGKGGMMREMEGREKDGRMAREGRVRGDPGAMDGGVATWTVLLVVATGSHKIRHPTDLGISDTPSMDAPTHSTHRCLYRTHSLLTLVLPIVLGDA